MLVRILNTLRSRIWDMVFFLFSDYLNPQLVRMGIFQKVMDFPEIKFMLFSSEDLFFAKRCFILFLSFIKGFIIIMARNVFISRRIINIIINSVDNSTIEISTSMLQHAILSLSVFWLFNFFRICFTYCRNLICKYKTTF